MASGGEPVVARRCRGTWSVRRAVDALRQDLRIATRHLAFDVLAGSSFTPRPLRYLLYRSMGLDIRTMNIFSGMRVTGSGLHIGRGTFVNHDCYFEAAGRIDVGEDCNLGPQVMLLTSTHHLLAGGFARHGHNRHTVVGDRVWLGARVTVLPGAVIESDCIIAGGAVVTGRCKSGGIYGGVPARRLRDVADERSPD